MTPPWSVRRILMTTDAVGGAWNYALELCRGLGGHGVHVVLATMGPRPSPAQRAAARALDNLTLEESDHALEWMPQPWAGVDRAGEWLLALEREHRPDLIHLNGYSHGALPWQAPSVVVGHSCVLSWWRAVHRADAPAEWSTYRERVRTGLHAATTVVAPSRTMLACLVRHYGALPRSEVIANGCDASAFRAENKEPFVLAVGRLWDEAKNVAALARVAPQLPWPVRVAGSTVPPAGMAAGAGLSNVDLLGVLSPADLNHQYARAAIYALPARYEPFGLSVLEAALSGCALVLGDIPSLRENWDGAALFVPPDDAAALTEAITTLATCPARRAELAGLARERGRQFSATTMVNHYLATYERALATPVPAGGQETLSA